MKRVITLAMTLCLGSAAAYAETRDHGREPVRQESRQGGPSRMGPATAPHEAAQALAPRYGFGGRPPETGFRQGTYLGDHGWVGARFRGGAFRYPPGWGYRYWAFGAFLPSVFITSDFTIWQYWVYGLPAPPPGYHWIRVGPDALLVRYGDGYILDAAYGLFY